MNGLSSDSRRLIAHVDMDHFFSAVEEREHPEYRGRPVIVGADPDKGKGRGVVKTCNYPARKYGVCSGMSISRAWRLCPEAVYTRANYPLYREVSDCLMSILRRYSKNLQACGFDEAFVDISSEVHDLAEAVQLAASIKHEILWEQSLTCSVGIAPNKLVAKIASDFEKPDGLTVVGEDDVEEFLKPLCVRKMPWIGKKTEYRLNQLGIKTIGDLAAARISLLTERFGVMGKRYHFWACGKYESRLGRRRTRKSAGHEKTFPANTKDRDAVLQELEHLCLRVHEKIKRKKLLFKTVTVKIRYGNFTTCTRGKTLPHFTDSLMDLQKVAQQIAHDFVPTSTEVRLVGVRVSNLTQAGGQVPLL
jgi:DNA polymerase IV (DinB-like DNA polymerase)